MSRFIKLSSSDTMLDWFKCLPLILSYEVFPVLKLLILLYPSINAYSCVIVVAIVSPRMLYFLSPGLLENCLEQLW